MHNLRIPLHPALALLLVPLLIVALSLTQPSSLGAQATDAPGHVVNGVDTQALGNLIEALEADPDAGRVTFFSRSRWQDGMRAFTTFTGYEVDGRILHEQEREFVLLGDEGVEIGGTDAAPGAVEELMYALGTCIIAAANANAALMGVELTQLEVDLESDLDLHGLFALDPEVRPGIIQMRATITIDGDADDATLREIAQLGYRYSPVSDSVRKGISVEPRIVTGEGDEDVDEDVR